MPVEQNHQIVVRYGLLHSELEQGFIRDIQKEKTDDPLSPIVVLVGSRLLADYLMWLIAESNINGFNIHFVTFAQIGRDLNFDAAMVDIRPEQPPTAELTAAVDATSRSVGSSGLTGKHYFDNVVDRPGFRRALVRSFNDLDNAGIGDLDEATQLSFPKISSKFKALASLRRQYLEHILQFRRPLDNLTPPADPGTSFRQAYSTDKLYLYGLYDFTTLQKRLIRSLAGSVELIAYLPYIEDAPAFRYAQSGFDFFQSLSPQVREDGHSCPQDITGAINAFGRRLFQYKPNDAPPPIGKSHLSIFRASDPSAEVEGIVGRINEMVLWDGVPLDRIGILLWDQQAYYEPLKFALKRAQLPFADFLGTTIAQTPQGRTLTGLLRLIGRRLKRRDVIDFIASTELILDDSESDEKGDPVVWEAISIETKLIEEDRRGWNYALQAIKKSSSLDNHPAKQGDQIDLFLHFINRLFDQYELLSGSNSWRDLTQRTVALIRSFLEMDETTDNMIDTIHTLSGLDTISETVQLDHFIETVETAMGMVTVDPGRFRVDGITLCDKMTARGVHFDVLFIPGMIQGDIPVYPREDPILTDSDRNFINKIYSSDNEPLLPLKSDRLGEEQLLLALAVDSARERLIVSYPTNSTDGKQLLPSRFLLELCRIASIKSHDDPKPLETDGLETHPQFEDATGGNRNSFLQRLTDPNQFLPQWIDVNVAPSDRRMAYHRLYSGYSVGFDRIAQVMRARQSGNRFTVWDGVVVSGTKRPPKKDRPFSVTSLEQYATCPFRYLVQHIYRADPWEEPEQLIQPPTHVIGSIIHRALEYFYQRAYDKGYIPLTPDIAKWTRQEMTGILDGLKPWAKKMSPVPGVVWEIEFGLLRSRLKRFVSEECEKTDTYHFASAERAIDYQTVFGHSDDPKNVKLSGKIDRIDRTVDGKGIRIIDYKTGVHKPSDPDDYKGGRNLQLPIYLMALLSQYDDIDPAICEAQYLYIDTDGSSNSLTLTASALIEREEELRLLVGVITDGIENGLFPPMGQIPRLKRNRKKKDDESFTLSVENICGQCSVRSVCDIRSRKSSEHRLDDPRLSELIGVYQGVDND
ncbi:MAG: exodeoxyribonuclease V subunit gamma [Candidatus Electryoneaceae bacterium]|nr:exodeoxyribonuclease V subunit gamma [Candidatus Electryoneaceae bacterium]